jgi:hypothetical protein
MVVIIQVKQPGLPVVSPLGGGAGHGQGLARGQAGRSVPDTTGVWHSAGRGALVRPTKRQAGLSGSAFIKAYVGGWHIRDRPMP